MAIVVAMLALLALGLNVERTAVTTLRLVSVDLAEAPQPTGQPKAPEPRARKPAPRHEASPRNVRNEATAVVAPPVRPLVVPPVVTAPQAGIGSAANNGASSLPGPGQGAGGAGNGLGGGGLGGNGAGDGDGEAVVGPRQTGGKMSYKDLPEGVLGLGQEASVDVVYAVNPDGRASNCRAEHSSGYPLLDNLACRLIEQRFRFKPARDRLGRPVRAWVEETHSWIARER
ncbi:MAG TPA: TonB family protein [Croceibacterium sp.]|nr:TonB family protein [Croceibacterium sp.]